MSTYIVCVWMHSVMDSTLSLRRNRAVSYPRVVSHYLPPTPLHFAMGFTYAHLSTGARLYSCTVCKTPIETAVHYVGCFGIKGTPVPMHLVRSRCLFYSRIPWLIYVRCKSWLGVATCTTTCEWYRLSPRSDWVYINTWYAGRLKWILLRKTPKVRSHTAH